MNEIKIEQQKEFSEDLIEGMSRLLGQLIPLQAVLKREVIEEMIQNNKVFIARDVVNGKIVGMQTLIVYRIPSVKKGVLEEIVIDEEYRGRKIGTALLKAALDEAKNEGIAYVDLHSSPKREVANKMYPKFGFVKRETNVYRLNLNEYE